jgi:hypothetical protein
VPSPASGRQAWWNPSGVPHRPVPDAAALTCRLISFDQFKLRHTRSNCAAMNEWPRFVG